jgi:hypothetical protein
MSLRLHLEMDETEVFETGDYVKIKVFISLPRNGTGMGGSIVSVTEEMSRFTEGSMVTDKTCRDVTSSLLLLYLLLYRYLNIHLLL